MISLVGFVGPPLIACRIMVFKDPNQAKSWIDCVIRIFKSLKSTSLKIGITTNAPCYLIHFILFRFFLFGRGVTKGKLLRHTQIHNMLKCQLVLVHPNSFFLQEPMVVLCVNTNIQLQVSHPNILWKCVLRWIGHVEDRSSYSRTTTNSTPIFTIILCSKL